MEVASDHTSAGDTRTGDRETVGLTPGQAIADTSSAAAVEVLPPAFGGPQPSNVEAFRGGITRATADWLARTPALPPNDRHALGSICSCLSLCGYMGVNPAHGKFVKAPTVGKDGKTPGLSPTEWRRLLNAPNSDSPAGLRDRALLGVLAYTGCRVGELTRLRVRDYRSSGGHKILAILGKGGKERTVPLHPEAFERLDAWIEMA